MDKFVQTLYLHLFRYVVGQVLGGVCTGALAVLEHESRVEHALAYQRESLGVVLRRFVMVAHEEVGGESAVGDDASYGSHTLQVLLTRILTVHELQNLA